MKKHSVWLIVLLAGLLFSIPISAQVVNATVKIDGMI
jgi:beta-lactamase regulating signal transducer with metallopeptidase domain